MNGTGSTNKSKRLLTSSSLLTTPSASIESKRKKITVTSTKKTYSPTHSDSSGEESGEEKEKPKCNVPLELFVKDTTPTQLVGDEVAVCSLVSKRLFPHVKFITDPDLDLAYNNEKSICSFVCSNCTQPINIEEKVWWENARKWVGRQVAILRSSKNTRVKWCFMSKWKTFQLGY